MCTALIDGLESESSLQCVAICSNLNCDFVIERNGSADQSIETPGSCPKCAQPMVTRCPLCRFSLLGNKMGIPDECLICRAEVRAAFAKQIRQRASEVCRSFGSAKRFLEETII